MCKHSKHDLALRFLADAVSAGAFAATSWYTEAWCAAHGCTEAELDDALAADNAATEAAIRRHEDEEWGALVNQEAKYAEVEA